MHWTWGTWAPALYLEEHSLWLSKDLTNLLTKVLGGYDSEKGRDSPLKGNINSLELQTHCWKLYSFHYGGTGFWWRGNEKILKVFERT